MSEDKSELRQLTTSQVVALQVLQEQFNNLQAQLARVTSRMHAVMREAGLDPEKSYDVDDDGHVVEKAG